MLQVLAYGDALKELENAGEVNIKLSMHNLDRSDESKEVCFRSQKKVCFVLDQPKDNKKKKASCPKTKTSK